MYKKTLGEILSTLTHTINTERTIVFSYQNRFEDQSFTTFYHDVLEDRHMMMNKGKMPNSTWDVEFVGFEDMRNGETAALFDLKCRKPKFPDESFLYGCEIGVLATMKKGR